MNLINFLILLLLLINSINLLQDPEQISQCGNGKATYYDATSGGNCGFGDITKSIDTAAAETIIYDNSNACGICYEVFGEKGSKIVMIADHCPGCERVIDTGRIHLDIDTRVFPYIDDKAKGRVDTSIRMVPCKVSGNVILHITETNDNYFNAYVTNYKIGVKALEISINGQNYINVKRESWNRFIARLSGNINNLKVKIIGISGEEIICANLGGVIKGDYNCGKQFSTDKFFDLYSRKVISSYKKTECCKKQSLIKNITACKVDTNPNPNPNPNPDSNHSKYLKLSILVFLLYLNIF
jgi:expansin (peptidoglycan-binding protein)